MGFKWTDKIDNIDKIYAKDINAIAKQVVNLSNAAKPMIVVTAEQIGGNFIIDAPWFNNTMLSNGDMFFIKPRASDQIEVYSHAYIQFADQGEYARPYQIITPTNKSEFLPDFFNRNIPFVVIYESNVENDPAYGGFIVIDKYMTPTVTDASNDDSSLAGEETTMLYSGEVPELPLQSQTGVTLEKDNVLYMWNGWTWRSLGGTSGAMVFKGVVSELPETANENEVYALSTWEKVGVFNNVSNMTLIENNINFSEWNDLANFIYADVQSNYGCSYKFVINGNGYVYADCGINSASEEGFDMLGHTDDVESYINVPNESKVDVYRLPVGVQATNKLYIYYGGEWVETSKDGVTKAEMESYIEETLLGGEW